MNFNITPIEARILGCLIEKEATTPDGPYTTMLARQEGRKDSRYTHLFCGEPDDTVIPGIAPERAATGADLRLQMVELEVSELKSELHDLKQRFEQLITSRFA